MKKIKNSLIYPERVIERSLGKVPVSKELLDIHNRKRSSTFKFFLYITGIFSIMSLMVRESMIPDVVDEIHASTGLRQDGTISALTSFCAKCMTGFGQFFSMLILWIIGYPNIQNNNKWG